MWLIVADWAVLEENISTILLLLASTLGGFYFNDKLSMGERGTRSIQITSFSKYRKVVVDLEKRYMCLYKYMHIDTRICVPKSYCRVLNTLFHSNILTQRY